MMDRRWLPTFSELIDRLSIHQLKEVMLPECKDKYDKEMQDIMYDMEMLIDEHQIKMSAGIIRLIIILSQINTHIWYNESKARKGEDQDIGLLKLTHGLNGIRNMAMNILLEEIGTCGRQDWKVDCLAAEFSDWKILFLEERSKK